MAKEVRLGVQFTVVTMLLFGGIYHVVLWGIGWVALPAQADGSMVQRQNGLMIGSRLIAQRFERPEYFHPRPSAVDYDAASTGGSNYGPANTKHLKEVQERVVTIVAEGGVTAAQVPSEMVTASGAGLDPHIPPNAAALQAARVARSRNIPADAVRQLIAAHTEPPTLGFLGRARVNVLELNIAIDDRFGPPALVNDPNETNGQ
jgi:potassium-transporting ATPase KdpC subunit